MNVETARTSPPRGLEVTDVGRLNGGLRDPVGGGLKAGANEVGDREMDRRAGSAHRDIVDGDLGVSSAIDLTMYGTTPAARGMVSPYQRCRQFKQACCNGGFGSLGGSYPQNLCFATPPRQKKLTTAAAAWYSMVKVKIHYTSFSVASRNKSTT